MDKKKQIPEGEVHHRVSVQLDFGYKGSPGKKMSGESMTVPDMNLTVRQLLENHSRGIDGKTKVQQPIYFELPVPVIKDMTDVDEYRRALERQLDATNEFIKKEKERREKEEEAELQKEMDELPFETHKQPAGRQTRIDDPDQQSRSKSKSGE